MKKVISTVALAAVFLSTPAFAKRFCTHSYWVTMGGERVKVCCAQGLCTTKYGVYQK